jgi:hypothetical protein
MINPFTTFGFFKEYYVGLKYIGSLDCERDREVLGYMGRREETLDHDVVFKNKKIKAGTKITTQLQQYCGKSK